MIKHTFAEGSDPRARGRCVRCGRLPKDHEQAPARDLAWEKEFYKNLIDAVTARAGMDAAPLVNLTQRRMGVIGADQYGDSSFLTDGRDLIVELRDEAADTIAYVVMEMQKLLANKADEPLVVQHLFEAAVYACIADAHARAAQRVRHTS